MKSEEKFHCLAVCLADSFHYPELRERLLSDRRTEVFRNVLICELRKGTAAVFAFGVVVYWNVELDARREFQQLLNDFARNPLEEAPEDGFSYGIGFAADRFQYDHIELQTGDAKVLLALSHAMAQSIKLAAFENQVIGTIGATRHLPESLASRGRIALKAKAMTMVRGQLFLTRSNIILHYDLLETPDFFWEYPEYQGVYSMAANYLEIQPRTEILSKKLDTIHELLEMLADEQKHHHSSTLEWIIIWLIAVEILMSISDRFF